MKITLTMQVEFIELALEEMEDGLGKQIMEEIANNLRAIKEAEDDFNEFYAPETKVLH